MAAVFRVSVVFLMLQLASSVRVVRKQSCVEFLILGDFGKMGSIQTRVRDGAAKVAASVNPNAILALGDNVYESGVTSSGMMKREWRDIWLAKSALKRKWYGVTGNHDWRSDARVMRDFTKSSSNSGGHWNMPDFWYKKKWGIVEIFFVDTYVWRGSVSSMKSKISTQRNWLESALKSSTASWKIVVGHHPTWSVGTHGGDSTMKRELDPMMRKYKANIYLAGHDHNMAHMNYRNVNYVVCGGCSKTARGKSNDYPTGSLKEHSEKSGFMGLKICNKDTATLTRYNSSGSARYTARLQNLAPGSGGSPPSPPSPSPDTRRRRRRQ